MIECLRDAQVDDDKQEAKGYKQEKGKWCRMATGHHDNLNSTDKDISLFPHLSEGWLISTVKIWVQPPWSSECQK